MTGKTCRAAVGLTLLAVVGCSKTPATPAGPPVLLGVTWQMVDPETRAASTLLAWAKVSDPPLENVMPARPAEVDLYFDRPLDGDKIEDPVTVGGVQTAQPKPTPPVSVSWPNMEEVQSTPAFRLTVRYDSSQKPNAFGAPVRVFALATPSFPSDTEITMHLVKQGTDERGRAIGLMSQGVPMDGPDSITFKTDVLRLEIRAPGVVDGGVTPVSTSARVTLVFNNTPADVSTVSRYVHVYLPGAVAVPAKLVGDPVDPRLVYVYPADCIRTWPSGADLTVVVDEGVPDAFGIPLAGAWSVTFRTAGEGADGGAFDASGCG